MMLTQNILRFLTDIHLIINLKKRDHSSACSNFKIIHVNVYLVPIIPLTLLLILEKKLSRGRHARPKEVRASTHTS